MLYNCYSGFPQRLKNKYIIRYRTEFLKYSPVLPVKKYVLDHTVWSISFLPALLPEKDVKTIWVGEIFLTRKENAQHFSFYNSSILAVLYKAVFRRVGKQDLFLLE